MRLSDILKVMNRHALLIAAIVAATAVVLTTFAAMDIETRFLKHRPYFFDPASYHYQFKLIAEKIIGPDGNLSVYRNLQRLPDGQPGLSD